MAAAITSRLKIMARLDISERRLPQDGRIKIKRGGGKEMDFRVSVCPTLFGEKVVMRLLDKSNLQLDMTKLGFEEKALRDFKEQIHKPFGMVLVTGPTGSGKTTTLYSALSELNKVSENIITAEDPVEFNLPGVNQIQVRFRSRDGWFRALDEAGFTVDSFRICRPSNVPPFRSIRENAWQSSMVATSPPAPEGKSGGWFH
jgi:type II secretory ATPase GspE/PulE/Tfp pilus assembly ATPase PilB-like protein